jgi:thiol-disulfide isomerase/thioredoxin
MAVDVLTDTDFQSYVSGSSKVVVKYFADWCGTCKLMAPKYKRLSGDERFTGIAFAEVNAEQNPEARKIAGVNNLPFIAIFRDGKLVKGDATSKEENVVAMLNELQ